MLHHEAEIQTDALSAVREIGGFTCEDDGEVHVDADRIALNGTCGASADRDPVANGVLECRPDRHIARR